MSHFQKITTTGKPAESTAKTHAAVIDSRHNLMWTAKDIGIAMFAGAPDLINDLNRQAFAGFTDWRLPTIEELLTLVDRTRHHPAINTDAFPSCLGGWYWSSTVDAESPSDFAWYVHFNYGYCSLSPQTARAASGPCDRCRRRRPVSNWPFGHPPRRRCVGSRSTDQRSARVPPSASAGPHGPAER